MTTSPLHSLGPSRADGPVVLFAHGMADSWRSWRPLADRFDPSWRLLCAELPWQAGTGYGWRRRATPGGCLAAVVHAMPEPPDVIVGHSLGANAVLELLATEPGAAPRGAMLVAPFYCPPDLDVTWEVFERSRANFVRIISEGLRLRLGDRLTAVGDEVAESMLGKMIERIGPVGFTTLFEMFVASADLPLGAVTVPTMVLSGGRDPSLDGPRVEALRRSLPDAEVVVEPEFGHFCHVARTGEVARYVTTFVQKICAARPAEEVCRDHDR